MATQDPTQAQATLSAAAMTAAIALTAAVITAAVALWNESKRRKETRAADELRRRETRASDELKELRLSTATVFAHLFALQHEVEWLTWHARNAPERVNKTMVAQYNKAIHAAYPALLGAMAVIAAFDKDLFERLKGIADELYTFEGQEVALAAMKAPDLMAVETLSALNERAREFYVTLPNQLADAMADAKVLKEWASETPSK